MHSLFIVIFLNHKTLCLLKKYYLNFPVHRFFVSKCQVTVTEKVFPSISALDSFFMSCNKNFVKK